MVHVPHGWLVLDLQPLGAEPHECGDENRVAAPPLRGSSIVHAQCCVGASEGRWPTSGGATTHGL